MNIVLTPSESELLLANSETKDLVSALLVAGEKQVLKGTEDQFDELREAVSDVLMRIGFDEEYKATSVGVVLEGLIDKLFVG